jgi:hypothetical protein
VSLLSVSLFFLPAGSLVVVAVISSLSIVPVPVPILLTAITTHWSITTNTASSLKHWAFLLDNGHHSGKKTVISQGTWFYWPIFSALSACVAGLFL